MATGDDPKTFSTEGSTPSGSAAAGGTGSSATGAGGRSAEELLGRVVRGTHEAIDRLAEQAAPRVRRLQEGVAGAGEKLHEGADTMLRQREEWTESLRGTVRDNPLAAVATAVVIGMLLARLTR